MIASTAYVESEFKMTSRPCIGMMQLVRPSIRYYDPKRVYNPYTVDGNIAIGTKELSRHLKGILEANCLTELFIEICTDLTMDLI